MNQKNQNTVNMLQAVLGILLLNPTVTESIRVLAGYITKLQSLIGLILTKAGEASNAREGKTDVKKDHRAGLIALTVSVAGGIKAFATDTKNLEMKAKVKLTKSSLRNLSDLDLSTKAGLILSLANEWKGSLPDYGVADQDIQSLGEKKNLFDGAKSDVKTGISTGSGARKSHEDLIKEARTLLTDNIDGVVETLKEKQPEFYTSYQSARVIWDMGGSKAKTEPPKPPTP